MSEKQTIERAKQDKREGKAASTQAGEFVREEMDHIREGKHGARSAKQAIAIGRSGVPRSCAGVDLAAARQRPNLWSGLERAAKAAYRRGQSGSSARPSVSKGSRATEYGFQV